MLKSRSRYVRGELNGQRCIELESAGVHAIANSEVVRRIFCGGVGENVNRYRIDIHQGSTGWRLGVVVKSGRQTV